MAMDGIQLGIDMAAAARATFESFDPTSPVTDAEVDEIWKATAQKIVDHITSNAVTSTVVTGGSSAGTYPGTIT